MKTLNGKTYLSLEDYEKMHPPIPKNTKVKTKTFGIAYIVGYNCVLKGIEFISWKYCIKNYNTAVGLFNPTHEIESSDIYE